MALGLKCEGQVVCEGLSGCLKIVMWKIKAGGRSWQLAWNTYNQYTRDNNFCRAALAYPDPQETHAAPAIGRDSDSLQIFSSAACSGRLFHFTLLNIKSSKHFHLSVLYCQSNYPFVTVSHYIGNTSLGNFKILLRGETRMYLNCLVGVRAPKFYFQLTICIYSSQIVSFPSNLNGHAIKTPPTHTPSLQQISSWLILKIQNFKGWALSTQVMGCGLHRSHRQPLSWYPELVAFCHFSGCHLLVLWNCSLLPNGKHPEKM